MCHTVRSPSPLGPLLLAADGQGLRGLWFEGAKYFAAGLDEPCLAARTPVLDEARRWLDIYFAGRDPGPPPPLSLHGTSFQRAVWALLLEIPYGQTTTYGALARRLGIRSAQAIGGAVGHNPLSIFIPCHRVVGADGSLTGYAGGVAKKRALLELEGVDLSRYRVPVTR